LRDVTVWKAKENRIPSFVALLNRGIPIDSPFCSSCIGEEETCNHLLVACPFAGAVWKSIFDWCGVPANKFRTVREILIFAVEWRHSAKEKKGLCFYCLWCGLVHMASQE